MPIYIRKNNQEWWQLADKTDVITIPPGKAQTAIHNMQIIGTIVDTTRKIDMHTEGEIGWDYKAWQPDRQMEGILRWLYDSQWTLTIPTLSWAALNASELYHKSNANVTAGCTEDNHSMSCYQLLQLCSVRISYKNKLHS